MTKKTIYVDMDGVLCDYIGACNKLGVSPKEGKHLSNFFKELRPIDGAVNALNTLIENGNFELYILSTSPWSNPEALCEKLIWVKENLPEYFYKRVIFSHHKNLNIGDYLIDDTKRNGAAEFTGIHIHFGTDEFPNWETITKYLLLNTI